MRAIGILALTLMLAATMLFAGAPSHDHSHADALPAIAVDNALSAADPCHGAGGSDAASQLGHCASVAAADMLVAVHGLTDKRVSGAISMRNAAAPEDAYPESRKRPPRHA